MDDYNLTQCFKVSFVHRTIGQYGWTQFHRWVGYVSTHGYAHSHAQYDTHSCRKKNRSAVKTLFHISLWLSSHGTRTYIYVVDVSVFAVWLLFAGHFWSLWTYTWAVSTLGWTVAQLDLFFSLVAMKICQKIPSTRRNPQIVSADPIGTNIVILTLNGNCEARYAV